LHYLSLINTHHITYPGLRFGSIPDRYRSGIWDPQPDPFSLLPPSARSRPGLEEFPLGLNPIPGRVQTPLARDRSDLPKSRAGGRSGSGFTLSEPISGVHVLICRVPCLKIPPLATNWSQSVPTS